MLMNEQERVVETGHQQKTTQPLIFAAASLKNALDELADSWRKKTRQPLRIVYDGSSRLARQIEKGAPAALYISANQMWMEHLAKIKLIDETSRINLLGNRLVLLAHEKQGGRGHEITSHLEASSYFKTPENFLNQMKGQKIALAQTAVNPAGIYAKMALTSLDLWQAINSSLIETANVRAALALVERGDVPFAIVYQSDSLASKNTRVIGQFPLSSHPEIIYPAALIKNEGRTDEQTAAFLNFLSSASANEIFIKHGFTRPAAKQPTAAKAK